MLRSSPRISRGRPRCPPSAALAWAVLLAASLLALAPAAHCAPTPKDAQIIAKALGFLDPAPAGGVLAVAYDGANPASKADAQATAALFAGGLAEGSSSVTAKAVDATALSAGSYIGIIAAKASSGDVIMQAAVAHKIPCITVYPEVVQSAKCVMSVQSDPKVEITVNHAAAQSTGVSFQSAFRMLIHEI